MGYDVEQRRGNMRVVEEEANWTVGRLEMEGRREKHNTSTLAQIGDVYKRP